MRRHGSRWRIAPDGDAEVIDPDLADIDVLEALNPDFKMRTASLERFRGPRVRQAVSRRLELSASDLRAEPTELLWHHHDECLVVEASTLSGGISLMDVKVELARRALAACQLCGHRCGVDRGAGARGRCGLDAEAYVAEWFVHVAEEPPINPALNLNMAGCGLRCRFCQQWRILGPRPQGSRRLEAGLWNELSLTGARSLAFVGGNPDESVYGILRFLAAAPENFALPVVWNCHGYATDEVYRLLEGVVDCFVPDFKYWDDGCAERWSGVHGYRGAVMMGLRAMAAQGVPVFVRILVLPGHLRCCHRPALEWLGTELGHAVRVHIMGQYHPDHRVPSGPHPLGARPDTREVQHVRELARQVGLRLVEGMPEVVA